VMTTAGSGSSIFGWAGEARDATGLVFLRARYYSSTTGRFFVRDTWPGNMQMPGTLHPYLYTEGNPVNYTDPSGHCILGIVVDTVGCVLIVGGVVIGVAYIGITIYNSPQAHDFARAVEDVIGICERYLAPPITRPNERVGTGEDPFALPYEYRAPRPGQQPQPKPTVVPPVQISTATPEEEVEYLHLTTAEYAADILSNGIRAEKGQRSGNDLRFFAWTLAPRYSPPTTAIQLMEMMDDLRSQSDVDFPHARLKVVHVLLPEQAVTGLERSGQLHYGPYLQVSAPGLTESIFEVSSFPTVNQYRSLWYPTDYR